MNLKFSNDTLAKTWAKLFSHMIAQMLSRITTIQRFHTGLVILPQPSISSKSLMINEVYNDNYNMDCFGTIGINNLALHPKTGRFPILNRYKTEIWCNVYANDDLDEISIDFINKTDHNIFVTFFEALHTNINSIIDTYFKKIHFYYIFDQYREYTFENELLMNQYDIGIVQDPTELQVYEQNIRFIANESQLKTVEKHIQRFHPQMNLSRDLNRICQLWADIASAFVIDILTKVFAITLSPNNHALQFHINKISFRIHGAHDVISNRRHPPADASHFRHGYLSKEIFKTIMVLNDELPYTPPLRALLHINSDNSTHKLITINFYNLNGTTQYPMNRFIEKFKTMYGKLLDDYFNKLLEDQIVFNTNYNYM